MTKSSDEIMKGLECCMDYQNCTEGEDPQCPYYDAQRCMEALLADALALIQQLQAENTEKDARIQHLEAERDALIGQARENDVCVLCKHKDVPCDAEPCVSCCAGGLRFEWRGVQKEESPC